jgi:hypothetical protein
MEPRPPPLPSRRPRHTREAPFYLIGSAGVVLSHPALALERRRPLNGEAARALPIFGKCRALTMHPMRRTAGQERDGGEREELASRGRSGICAFLATALAFFEKHSWLQPCSLAGTRSCRKIEDKHKVLRQTSSWGAPVRGRCETRRGGTVSSLAASTKPTLGLTLLSHNMTQTQPL